jgi:aminoglycoside phosphotransferase (APT) family kinase protein
VLGRLHATRDVGGRRVRTQRPTGPLVVATRDRLARLCARGAIAADDVRALRGVLRRFDPGRAVVGVTHNDFCPENVVERRGGELVAVDNEGMRIGFLDYDLARTWYRWAMPAPAWASFLDAYARWRDPGGYVRHAPFWSVTALVKSAHVRFGRTDAADVPLRRLRDIAASARPPARKRRRTAR